jgi:hypothetical protein
MTESRVGRVHLHAVVEAFFVVRLPERLDGGVVFGFV